MSSYTRRRLFAAIKLGLASIPFFIVLTLIHGYEIVPGTFILGFGAGFAIAFAELFFFKNLLKNLPFLLHLIGKSLILIGVLYITFAFLNLLDVVIEGITWQNYFAIIFSQKTLLGMIEALGIIAFLLFFIHLDRLLGPGVLLGYVTGRYYRPRKELRIFMFLDLKGSTKLADEMDANQYFDFLHLYFSEMSEPILETGAEIYQYVGDEVVLSWKMKNGLEEANCIRLFFLIEKQIHTHREYFLTRFGNIPQFKAGIHAGEVVVAQIGELKSEIVYNGDVLNTTARIQAKCNQLGYKLLISTELAEKINTGPKFKIVKLGPVDLRGKSEAIELSTVSLLN